MASAVARYRVTQLSYNTDSIRIAIASRSDGTCDDPGTASSLLDCDGWQLTCFAHGDPEDEHLALMYCPDPGRRLLAPVQFREQTEYALRIDGPQDLIEHLVAQASPVVRFLCSDAPVAVGMFNWGNYVGRSELPISLPGVPPLPVEVRSRKMGYLDDYERMLDDISAQISSLVFDYNTPTTVYQERAASDEHVAYLDYLFIKYLMYERRLPLHFRIIAADPHRAASREEVWEDLALAHSIQPRTVENILAYPEYLAKPEGQIASALQHQLGGRLPTRLLDQHVIITHDTSPNRFVKHFLARLVQKVRELEGIFDRCAASLAADCQTWRRELEAMSREHFLEQVGPMHVYPAGSQVLLKSEGYRQLNDYYRRFLLTGKVQWGDGRFDKLLSTPNKDVATLYEYWCFFQLINAVSVTVGSGPVDLSKLVSHDGKDFSVQLQQGCSVSWAAGQRLHYNHSYPNSRGSYSVTLRPDFVLEFGERKIVFDAKYRLEEAEVAQVFSRRDLDNQALNAVECEEEAATFKLGDLYKMHTYRDALGVNSAFVMYPGGVSRFFSKGGRDEALSQVFEGVGAISARILDTSALHRATRALLCALEQKEAA